MPTAALVVATYVAASVSLPQLIARAYGVDLHKVGTRNLGGGNLARNVGVLQGIAGGLLDALKPPLAMLFAEINGAPVEVRLLCGVVAVAAQQWPVWHRFDGGRGNSPAFAFFLGASLRTGLLCAPIVLLAALPGTLERLRKRRHVYSSGTPLGVLAAFTAYPFITALLGESSALVLASLATTALVVVRRLTAGLRADLRLSDDIGAILVRRVLYDRSESQRRALADAKRA